MGAHETCAGCRKCARSSVESAQLRTRQIKALSKWEKLYPSKENLEDLEGLTNFRGAKSQVGAVMDPKANDIWELGNLKADLFFFFLR